VLKADDFSLGAPPPPARTRVKRISPMGPDNDDLPKGAARIRPIATAGSQSAFASAIGATLNAIPTLEDNMPKGQYDRSKAKPRAKRADAGDAAAPGEAGATTATRADAKPSKKKRGGRKARAVTPPTRPRQVKASIPPGRRFGRWDDGSIDINLPCCSGHLSKEEGEELQAFLVGGRRAK
jgi:hypothetical protein